MEFIKTPLFFGHFVGFADFPGRMALTLFMPGCNLACPYCYNDEVVHGDPRLSLADIDECLRGIEYATNQKTAVVLSGGEPTIHEHFLDVVEHFARSGHPLGLHTNGLRDYPDMFNAVVLSLKSAAEGISNPEAYQRRLVKFISKEVSAQYKELRTVSKAIGEDYRLRIMRELAPLCSKHGWIQKIVENQRG